MNSFEECVKELFAAKFPDYTQHPMFEFLQRHSFKVTPLPPEDSSETTQSMGIRKNFRDVSRDYFQMPENKKNMLNCDQIFTLYLRDISAMVNETYYKKLMLFILLFRECLIIYGWQRRAEHEVKEYYG